MKLGFNVNSGAKHQQQFTDQELESQGWPVSYDFRTDNFCQKEILSYIEECLTELDEYDEKRDLKSDYLFHQHAFDAADDVAQTALELGLGEKVANNLYYATLIHDIGKMELDAEIWDYEESPTSEIKAEKRSHVDRGAQQLRNDFAGQDHPFLDLAEDIMANHHVQLNQLNDGQTLSNPARLVAIVEDYDGRSHLRAHHIEMGLSNDIPSILARQEEKCDGWFDADMYSAFKEIKIKQHTQNAPNEYNPNIEPN
jgi:HD-GYP domain-containing protein (c-di-GMP phosphodiesterase class II)